VADSADAPAQVIAAPKGGGAQRGIGETFSPDLHTGTANFSVPIAVPSGRNGFQPQLNLAYSSGRGNGLMGIGWAWDAVGRITRKTKGIPRYRSDRDPDGRDTYVLSGAEDLVPVADPALDPALATRYRPRTEGLFARIVHHHDIGTGANFWEVTAKSGLVSCYGTNPADHQHYAPPFVVDSTAPHVVNPRLDPDDPQRFFSWELTLSKDLFGNRIEYLYGVRDASSPDDEAAGHKWDQPLLTQIRYADYVDADDLVRFVATVTFEYEAERRPDPIADYRAGFEIRVTRRCAAIHVATHTDDEIKVRRFDLSYSNDSLNNVSLLSTITAVGFDDDGTEAAELPPLELSYTSFDPADAMRRDFRAVRGELPMAALSSESIELVDLFGRGIPDILEMDGPGTRASGRTGGTGRSTSRRRWSTRPPASRCRIPVCDCSMRTATVEQS
jgi:hypothetical protein